MLQRWTWKALLPLMPRMRLSASVVQLLRNTIFCDALPPMHSVPNTSRDLVLSKAEAKLTWDWKQKLSCIKPKWREHFPLFMMNLIDYWSYYDWSINNELNVHTACGRGALMALVRDEWVNSLATSGAFLTAALEIPIMDTSNSIPSGSMRISNTL